MKKAALGLVAILVMVVFVSGCTSIPNINTCSTAKKPVTVTKTTPSNVKTTTPSNVGTTGTKTRSNVNRNTVTRRCINCGHTFRTTRTSNQRVCTNCRRAAVRDIMMDNRYDMMHHSRI